MSRKLWQAALCSLALTACSADTRPDPVSTESLVAAGDVTAQRVAGGVRVTNGTSARIPYVVWDLGFLGLLGDCRAAEAQCPRLDAGQTATVLEGVDGFAGFGDAAVYWWGTKGDSTGLHTVIVTGGRQYAPPTPPSDTTR